MNYGVRRTEPMTEQKGDAMGLETIPCPQGYKLLRPIAQGRMGTVYKAYQISMDRKVAVKFLLPELTSDHKVVERFLQEARAVARLHHNGIVQGYDCGKCAGTYYLVMEYVRGNPLDKVIEKNKKLMEKWALFLGLQVARALQHAYRHGIIHRDLKPANILVDKKGRAKLTDFGLARLLVKSHSPNHDVPMTELDELVGTPCYMAPEQILGYQQLDTRCDLYALGIIFYHMITGEPPFVGTVGEILNKHLYEPLPDVREQVPEITQWTFDVIQRLTAKRPEARYASPRELILALTDVYNKLEWPTTDETIFKEDGAKSADNLPVFPAAGNQGTEDEVMFSGDENSEGMEEPPPLPPDSESAAEEVVELGQEAEQTEPEDKTVPPDARVFLVGSDGRGAGVRYELQPGEKVGIGRDSAFCRLPLLDPLVSRLHCTVTFDGQRVQVEDAGSQNGTFIGEKQIDSAFLEPGEPLKVGSTTFTIELE